VANVLDSSLTLRMTLVADQPLFARCAESALCWNLWGQTPYLHMVLAQESDRFLFYLILSY